jgi:hypothetical protein
MGHRTYLLIRAEGQVQELFEANNWLPVFWLGLLSPADLQAVEPQWQLLARLEQEGPEKELEQFVDQWPSLTNLILSRDAVAANSARTVRLLQQHHPELVALHQEFTQYLLAQLPKEAEVQLDVVALTAFSSSTEYLQSLTNELAAFDKGRLPLSVAEQRDQVLLTGFSTSPIPSAEYPVLSRLLAATNQPPRARELEGQTVPKRDVGFLLAALVAGALLLAASYRGFRQDGLTATVLLVLLVGVAVLAGGVAGLLARRPSEP